MAVSAPVTEPAPEEGLVDVCGVDEVPDGEVHSVSVGRRTLAIVRVAGRVYAFNAVCPHRSGPMDKGTLACGLKADAPGEPVTDPEERVLLCPWHSWEFSLEDGRAIADPSMRVRRYDAQVRDGRVLVALSGRSAMS